MFHIFALNFHKMLCRIDTSPKDIKSKHLHTPPSISYCSMKDLGLQYSNPYQHIPKSQHHHNFYSTTFHLLTLHSTSSLALTLLYTSVHRTSHSTQCRT